MSAEREPGEILEGRYRLVERLGRGGFGDVWRAEELLPDGNLLREVALKLLHASQVGQDWAAEARIIATLQHPALATIYAAGVLALEAPTPFVAMQLLEGRSLDDDVKAGRLVPWRRVLDWGRQAAAALDIIHRAGVVHLDLKPANLFVLADGALKVLDFGIARQGHRQADEVAIEAFDPAGEMSTAAFLVEHQSQEGDRPRGATSRFAVGTPGFMAPEIIEGGEATPASDAYALAALMVQLTTGSLPQVTSTQLDGTANTTQAWFAEVQAATLRGQLRDLSGLEVGLPRALVALLERWLSLDPVQRRLEAGGMGEALDAVWHCPQGVEPNPFKGLRPYGPEDEGRLPGRGPEIGRLSRELLDVPAVVLQADPGSGMRSLALAGVVPGLAKSFADGRDDWQPIVVSFAVKPKRSPDARVREAIAAHLEAKGREGDDLDALARACEEERLGAVMVLDDVDLALSHPPDERGLLGRLFHDDPEVTPGLRCVGTAGTDTTQTLIEDAALGEGLRPWLRFIGPVQAGLAGELILEPATAAGREVRRLEPVIEALRAELDQDGSRLPVLSVALQRFWEQSSGPLDGAAWEKHGGLLGYFSEHADEVIKGVEPELRDAIDAILLRLVPLDEERIEVERGDLLAVAGERGARALAALADARLLLRRGDAFRLAHPALGERWARLADLRLANLERLTFLQELRAAAQRWSAAAMARDLVWPAHRLREIDRHDDLERDLAEDERRFVQASRAAGRLAWGLRVMAVAFVLLVVAGAAWAQHTIEARALEQSIAVARERDRAAVGRMVTRSRRTEDPYLRVALVSGAMALGAEDPALPLDLLEASDDLPPAKFSTLSPVTEPDFPWGQRWLIGVRGQEIVIMDFEPPAGSDFAPVAFRFRPHATGVHDYVPFVFDTAFVTRALDGELAVWRLGDDGRLALAARSPMHCLRGVSPVLVAERAPVIACTTEEGVVTWDLRQPEKVARDRFVGRTLGLSADGRWLAVSRLRKLLLWEASGDRRYEMDVSAVPKVAAFSPRDPAVALVRRDDFEVLDLRADPPLRMVERLVAVHEPVEARFDEAGLDLAVCDFRGEGAWHYLREGGRAPEDRPPPPSARPCRSSVSPWPRPLADVRDYGPVVARRDVGPRVFDGGWQLEDGRLLTRDLVLLDPDDPKLAGLLHYAARPKERSSLGASAAAVVRDGDQLAWEVAGQIRIHASDGSELLRREGKLLALCPDSRVLGLRKRGEASWELFGARHDLLVRRIRREPALVVGVDPDCQRVVFQGLEGHLGSATIAGGADEEVAITWLSEAAEGVAYAAWPSPAREGRAAGLWVALSEGGVLRVDGASGQTQDLGLATPRAAALVELADGAVLVADDTGLSRLEVGKPTVPLLEPLPGRPWSDLYPLAPDRVVAAWPHGVAVLDLRRHEVVAEQELRAHGRLGLWRDDGSLFAWPFDFMGEPRATVLPFGEGLAVEVGEAASNLRAALVAGQPTLTLR